MPLKHTLNTDNLPKDGDPVRPDVDLVNYVQDQRWSEFDVDNFGELWVPVVVSQTDPPTTRSPGMLWFKRGEGRLYGLAGQTATNATEGQAGVGEGRGTARWPDDLGQGGPHAPGEVAASGATFSYTDSGHSNTHWISLSDRRDVLVNIEADVTVLWPRAIQMLINKTDEFRHIERWTDSATTHVTWSPEFSLMRGDIQGAKFVSVTSNETLAAIIEHDSATTTLHPLQYQHETVLAHELGYRRIPVLETSQGPDYAFTKEPSSASFSLSMASRMLLESRAGADPYAFTTEIDRVPAYICESGETFLRPSQHPQLSGKPEYGNEPAPLCFLWSSPPHNIDQWD